MKHVFNIYVAYIHEVTNHPIFNLFFNKILFIQTGSWPLGHDLHKPCSRLMQPLQLTISEEKREERGREGKEKTFTVHVLYSRYSDLSPFQLNNSPQEVQMLLPFYR